MCDVWVAEQGIRKGQYSTVEIYFSHENWTVEVEVFNKVRQVPIGISSYIADDVSLQIHFVVSLLYLIMIELTLSYVQVLGERFL